MARRRQSPGHHRPGALPSPHDLLGAESGLTVTGGGSLRIALVYPNTYSVGMASLGYHVVRQAMLASGVGQIERAFTSPSPGRSLESNRSLGDFDLLAFSIAFELDYLNIIDLLHAAGLPLFASRRSEKTPLVIVGGVAVSVNRHPIYPFADVLVHGEGEDTLAPLLNACRESGRDRTRLYEALRGIPGVEVTAGALRAIGGDASAVPTNMDEAVEANTVPPDVFIPAPTPAQAADLTRFPVVSRLVTPNSELGRRVLVEIARGCPHHCTFCWVGHNCRPFFPRPASSILALCEAACEETACESLGLVSAAVAAHPEIDAICESLLSKGKRLSFSSLRAEDIRPSILDALVRSGQRGITLAPETGDEQLRRLLGKMLPDDQFLNVVEATQNAGLTDVKLYFMTGLPKETEEDADRIVTLTDRVRHIMQAHGRARGRLGELSVNLGIYVPKRGTPLAQLETPPFGVVRSRARRLARALAALPNVRVAPLSPDLSAAQRLMSLGGLDSAAKLLQVWKTGGNWRPIVRDYLREHSETED